MNDAFVTNSLNYAYRESVSFRFPDITCRAGEHLLIMGPSGCGKTTLLHLLAGLLKPDSGTITIRDTVITRLSNSAMDRFRGENIGLVFQKPYFIRALSVIENIRLACSLSYLPKTNAEIEAVLERLDLAHKRNSRVNQMSEGELQRLSIARAVIHKPALVLADEPTSSLDNKNCEMSLALLQSQAELIGTTLIVVTHDQRLLPYFKNRMQLKS